MGLIRWIKKYYLLPSKIINMK